VTLPEKAILSIWQSQNETVAPLPVESLRRMERRFRKGVKLWLALELFSFVFVLLVVTRAALQSHNALFRVGCLMIVSGVAFALWQLAVRAFLVPLPADAFTVSWLDFHRRALERQRDAFLSAWKWLLLPVVPGLLVTQVALAQPHALARIFALDAAAFLFAAGWRFALGKVLQRRITKLDNGPGRNGENRE